jgi:hypothetical protein
LRDLLSGLDDDLPIVMSADSEGNSFGPYSDYSIEYYNADTAWSGDLWNADEIDDLDDAGNGTPEENGAMKVVVFWPVN